MPFQEDLYRLGLCFVDQVGPVIARTLVQYCGSPEAVFREKKYLLGKVPGVGSERIKSLRRDDALKRAEREMVFIEKNRVEILFFQDERYPRRLHPCPDAPALLFWKGNAELNTDHLVAVVGTRRQTEHGRRITGDLIRGWKEHRPTIVSGLALGIDSTAHEAALNNGLPTVAVLGHGLDRIYPSGNAGLARRIMENGGLLTEFPSGGLPDASNFPKRNRIVAGMTDATVVVEAAKKGGALITGQLAASYQRDVFAVPGRIDDEYSRGCLNLIRLNEAALISSPEDLIRSMGWKKQNLRKKPIQIELPVDFSTEEAAIISALGNGSLSVDVISSTTGKPISQVFALLTGLELRGLLRSLPGKRYELV